MRHALGFTWSLAAFLVLSLTATSAKASPPPKCTEDSDFGFSADKEWFCCGKPGNDPEKEHALFTRHKIYCNQGCVSSFVIEKKKVEWKDAASIEVRMLPAKGGANADSEVIIDNHHALWAACALGKIIKPVGLNRALKMPSNFAGGCANTKKLTGGEDTWANFNSCLGLAPPKDASGKTATAELNAEPGPNFCQTSADCAGHPKGWTKCCKGSKTNQCRTAGFAPCTAL